MAVSTATSYSPAVATASRSTATNSTPLQSLQHSLYPSSLPPSSYTSPATTPCTVASRLTKNPALPPQGMLGNDRLDPTRLSLNNGINHGDYIIGPLIQAVNGTPVKNISEYIAKKEGTDDFVILKVLTLSGSDGDHNEDRQGRMLLYNERSILSLLQNQSGVVHQHGFYCERNHAILVLDCVVGHEFDKEGRYKHFENLQHYIIREKRLTEKEALEIFSSALSTVEALHQKNIIHRDLKLGNMVLNRRTKEVTLTNFVLSKHLVRDGDELIDQRGSLAYVSPDVLSGQPYCGKASDMWAMGVLLYTMIYGQFPFYDSDPQELFKKIKTAKYTIPRDDRVSMATVVLIKDMMEVDTKKRISARRALDTALNILSRVTVQTTENDTSAQIVPNMDDKRHSSDITMAMKTEGLPSGSSHFTSNASMTTLQLSLSPIHADSQSTQVPNPVHPVAASLAFQGSPIHVATSPAHPTGSIPFQGSPVHISSSPVQAGPIPFHTTTLSASGGQQLILNSDFSSGYLLTPLAPSHTSNNSTAFFASPSPPSAGTLLNTSPTHSIESSSPVNIPTSPSNNAHSLHAVNGCHRPVRPSQSVDSYFTSHQPSPHSPSTSTPHHMRPTALLSSAQQQHSRSRSIILPSVSESGRSPENIVGSSTFIVSSPVDSIVTIRNAQFDDAAQNRHNFNSSDANGIVVGNTSSRSHRRRRNSSGDLNSTRIRRSSQGCHGVHSPSGSLEGTSLASATVSHAHHMHSGRTRRRSHDHVDRSRTSRSGSREPYTINPQ